MSLYALRRLTTLLACTVSLVSTHAQAAWPERPITLVVPYPAGGVADTISRAVAREVGERLGQPVVIENRPGASGKIGLEMVRRAAPDGYTIGLAVPATMVLLPLADARFGIGPQDFQPISLACETYTVLVVDPRLKVRTLPEFIQYGRGHAGMTYASAGNGTSFHFGAALLAQKLGIDATHVAYKGESPAMSDVAAGHVQFMLATNSAKAFIDGGKLVPIAVDAPHRVAALPNVPTFREQGVDYVSSGWIGYVGPRNLPADVTARFDSAFRAALQAPALRQAFTTMGYAPAEGGALAMGKAIAQDQARFRPLVQSGAVKLD
ncbi:Bug family tripartite tricarboxylate transporter substrate binding protein [Cupriavidus basilensis]|uniref:Bug family tripartite tricarboxylate transporter substrate binding protein n=1 Tax=Cupriavidus basilensis TaxID=68895 RepID=UPI0020A6B83D|nr:tripartite tricarboxylate transporter substrate binding protein [Cupriavidus basilensis]MCP3024091.1 tripartite tricarboxylate transporter substrate binding protein [Cupriavidus basilensis]